MSKKTLLEAHSLSKSFFDIQERHLFSHLSLKVEEGESVAIMGASGEGKSTLLHILGTLDTPTSGHIAILSKQVTRRNAATIRNQHIGFVFQSFHLLEDYTTIENILMPARIARKDIGKHSKAYKRALFLLGEVGLLSKANNPCKLLSGGEKQRVAIARALCNNPELILADEPSGNLDHGTSLQIHKLLLDLTKDQNKSMIVVTHDIELALLCDKVFILQNLQLQQRVL